METLTIIALNKWLIPQPQYYIISVIYNLSKDYSSYCLGKPSKIVQGNHQKKKDDINDQSQ